MDAEQLQQLQHLQTLRQEYLKRLRVLEVKQAQFGIDTPPYLLVEIDSIEVKIREIDSVLQNHNRPDVLATQQHTIASTKFSLLETDRVDIRLQEKFPNWTPIVEQAVVRAFAAIAEIPTESVSVLRVLPGSVRLLLEMPRQGADRLVALYDNGDLLLVDLGVLSIRKEERRQAKAPRGGATMSDETVNVQTDGEDTKEIPTPIGRTSATERDAITSDKFTFWLPGDVIVNPFDIVTVEQVNQSGEDASYTYGLVTTLEHRTDAPNHLANFISSNFGDLDEQPNTNRQGTTVAAASVLSNNEDIYMPVPSERLVYFADKAGIETALGIDQMDALDRIPAGLIKMSNGASTVAYIDRKFVLGPESAHVNISGISGLATKTSYAMFLLQSILQTADDPSDIAVIILNVKQGDLLRIDERGPDLSVNQKEMWEALGLKPTPFNNVHYLLPRSPNGQPNSFVTPNIYTLYAYDLPGTIDKFDLLFTNVADTTNTIESIIGDIMQGLEGGGEAAFKNVNSWQNLLYDLPLFDSKERKSKGFGDNKPASVGKFRRQLRRLVETRQTGVFVDSRSRNEKLLSDEITNIKGGHTYVVDIAKLKDEEQTLVFGDLLRTVYALKAEDAEGRTETSEIPGKIIFFVDELNKYAPGGNKPSPITEQVLDIAERGRSLGLILVSAQQFMSSVHSRVTGNSATKILGRTGAQEVNAPDYRFLDNDLKLSMTRLAKGELLVNHAIYRQPVKIVFPKPAYKQDSL